MEIKNDNGDTAAGTATVATLPPPGVKKVELAKKVKQMEYLCHLRWVCERDSEN